MTAEALQLPGVGELVADGRFELLGQLGEGGMSTVFIAADHVLGREVALKLLTARYVGRSEREQRLINEAEYLRRLQGHPHIVQYIDSGRLRDLHSWPWLATEVLSGTVLGWLLVRGRPGAAKTVTVARQILDALRGCHAAGIVHRDTTPNNVFELDDPAKTVKLFDFSHAADFRGPKVEIGAPERLTGIFDVPGTHGYMGPEQVQQDFADPSMDVFGFGILLYELVTGKNPYANMTDRAAFIKAQREGKLKPPRLHAWAYQAPEEFEQLVHDCTQREPSERPTIDELIERVDELADRLLEDAPTKLHTPAREPVEAPAWGRPPKGVVEATVRIDFVPPAGERAEATERVVLERSTTPEQPEVTATVDVPAMICSKPRQTVSPEVIGDWVARPQPVAVSAAAAAAVVQAPDIAPTAGEASRDPVELAFARPPELRAPPPEAEVEPEIEPLVPIPRPAVEPSPDDDDPGPVASGRGWLWGLAGVAVVVALMTWVWIGREPKGSHDQTEVGVEQAPSAPGDPELAPEVDDSTDSGDGPVLEPVPEVETTGGSEPEPQPEPEPEPQPKTKKKPQQQDDPKPDPCEGKVERARAALTSRDWRGALEHSANGKCWSSQEERAAIRVTAYMELGQWSKCVDAGARAKSAEIRGAVDNCRMFITEESK
ncbi:MAG TPA: serine/threonine-protein kinase [Enhygromyxa sp.]|nr:serine/threonine-protein kinase [Enhygromyxa sp.]